MNTTPASTTHATRTGKIARLPQEIRQQLNHRLDDGESAQELVAWLNATPAVQERLARYYAGRPITEQNLSDWKQGGFLDWQRHQETRGLLREFLCEAEELGEEAGEEMLLDRVVNMVAVVLLRLFRDAATAETGPEQRQAVLEIARELSRLRRGDHQRQRVKLLAERQRVELRDKEEARQQERNGDRALWLAHLSVEWECQLHELANSQGKMSAERFAEILHFYEKHEEELLEAGCKPMPKRRKMPGQAPGRGNATGETADGAKSPE